MNKVYAAPPSEGQQNEVFGLPPGETSEIITPTVTKQELQTEINKVQTQISELNTTIDTETAPFGSNTGYISIFALVLSLVVVILFLLINNKLSSRINDLTKYVEKLKSNVDKISDLNKEIGILSGENYELRKRVESLENKIKNTPTVEARSQVNFQKSAPLTESPHIPAPPPPTLLDKCKNFIADFNALNNFAPNEKREKRAEFFKKYQIKVFYCQNFNERMNDISLDPKFELSNQASNDDYWAYEVENNIFAVMPNIKNYNKNYHLARAMGEVFNSNFDFGNYANVHVIKPAIFKGMWNLSEKGELVLS